VLPARAAAPAPRRYGLALHTGLGQATRSLSEQYQEALAAADSALARGLRVVEAGDLPAGPALGALRRDLALGLDTEPNAVPVRFERYLAAVAHRSGYGLETARVHLEAGFERIVEVIQASGSIDARTLSTELGRLSQAAGEARTTDELFDAYRQAVGSLIELVADPHAARRDHGLDRAERYVRRHYAEPLGLERVARVAGYAPKYFSDLFRKKQGRTFESYVLGVRIERVKQLLSGSDLTLQRVAQLTGLGTGNYLGRVFQRSLGETPIAYRRRVRGALVAQRAREGARPKVSRRHSATIRHTPSVKFDE
jgi:AraC-like DNA-binding protein